jgi:hypothetical protein
MIFGDGSLIFLNFKKTEDFTKDGSKGWDKGI